MVERIAGIADLQRRDLMKLMGAAPLLGAAPIARSASESGGHTGAELPPVLKKAVGKWHDDMAWVAHQVRSAPYYNRSRREAEAGEYYIQQMASHANALALIPRPEFPVFYRETFLHPFTYNALGPNPDANYHVTVLDSSKEYRLWGNKNASEFVLLQVMADLWTKDAKLIGNHSLANFDVDAKGDFEIVLSEKPHEKNWIKLDGRYKRNVILVRNVTLNWADTPAKLNIEPLRLEDVIGLDLRMSEGELAGRISYAGDVMRYMTDSNTIGIVQAIFRDTKGKTNVMAFESGERYLESGGSPSAIYGRCVFELDEGEALVIHSDVPKARLMSFCTSDIWLQSPDFIYHQTSLNQSQLKLDTDGKLTLIVSPQDPGVHNWLDTLGNTFGRVVYRGFITDRAPNVTIKKVPFGELADHLPEGARRVSKQERLLLLQERARAGLRMHGY